MVISSSNEVKFIENIFSPGFILYNELVFVKLLSNFNFNWFISLFCISINFSNSDDFLILSFKLFSSLFLFSNSFSKNLILSFKSLFLFFSSFNWFFNSLYALSEILFSTVFILLSFCILFELSSFNIFLGMKSINVFEEKYNNKKYSKYI